MFNEKQQFELFLKVAGVHGKNKHTTVNKDFDATALVTTKWRVWMGYGFQTEDQARESYRQYNQEGFAEDIDGVQFLQPFCPEPEMVEITLIQCWGVQVRIKSKSLDISGYWDDNMGGWQNMDADTIADMESAIKRILLEGEWDGKAPCEYGSDPTGSLSDYE